MEQRFEKPNSDSDSKYTLPHAPMSLMTPNGYPTPQSASDDEEIDDELLEDDGGDYPLDTVRKLHGDELGELVEKLAPEVNESKKNQLSPHQRLASAPVPTHIDDGPTTYVEYLINKERLILE
jgi:hypothetical protein